MADIDFSKIFHQVSKDLNRGHPPISEDASLWPEAWRTVEYKAYPRLPKIALPRYTGSADLFTLLRRRTSATHLDSSKNVTLGELAAVLEYSCGVTRTDEGGKQHRAQPSGGGFYPLEVYPVVLHSAPDFVSGVYHYNVQEHRLDVLWEKEFPQEDVAGWLSASNKWMVSVSALLVITAVFSRTRSKYGERGYRLVLQEAGHIGQNAQLVASALGLTSCMLGGTLDERLERLLDVDGGTESVVYGMVFGK